MMGPSGSGKSTLLNVLTLSGTGGIVGGNVTIGGCVLTPAIYKRLCAYVPQQDHLWHALTPHEHLEFALAAFPSAGREASAATIIQALRSVGLQSCEHTRVGNALMPGLSGGQKRRLSLALAMVKNPLVLFADEITSGLDAASALAIVRLVGQLAKDHGMSVLCTIHQPSSAAFAKFDHTLLLSGGRVAYYGRAHGMVDYFAALGLQCPPQYNPAEFVMDLISSDFSGEEQVNQIIDAWQDSGRQLSMIEHKINVTASPRAGIFAQISMLLRRHARLLYCDGLIAGKIAAFVMSTCFFALVYIRSRDETQDTAVLRVWLIMWVAAVPTSLSVVTVFVQHMELEMVTRENKEGMYSPLAYIIAQLVIQTPLLPLLSIACFGPSVFGVGGLPLASNGSFIQLNTIMSALFLCSESFAQLCSLASHPILGAFGFMNFWFLSFLFSGCVSSA